MLQLIIVLSLALWNYCRRRYHSQNANPHQLYRHSWRKFV